MSAATAAPASPSASALTEEFQVERLSVNYGGVKAVESVSLTIAPGEALGIIGANGAGKTSTLRALMGLVPRASGTIRFGERNLTRASAHSMVRHGIGYVPEGRHVFSGLSVEKNLLLGGYSRGWRSANQPGLANVYERFPVLAEMAHRPAGALSGGQQQMLAIGRALMSQPRLVLLDEPSMGLSPKLVDEILGILVDLRAAGLSLLLVEQNAELAFGVTGRCLVMENGRVVLEGGVTQLREDEGVQRSYLGL
jgi:branched-chain amino acid transport system ATP-binding protein